MLLVANIDGRPGESCSRLMGVFSSRLMNRSSSSSISPPINGRSSRPRSSIRFVADHQQPPSILTPVVEFGGETDVSSSECLDFLCSIFSFVENRENPSLDFRPNRFSINVDGESSSSNREEKRPCFSVGTSVLAWARELRSTGRQSSVHSFTSRSNKNSYSKEIHRETGQTNASEILGHLIEIRGVVRRE